MNAVCLCSLLPVPENELKYSIPQRPLVGKQMSKGEFPSERCTDCFIQTFYYFTPEISIQPSTCLKRMKTGF